MSSNAIASSSNAAARTVWLPALLLAAIGLCGGALRCGQVTESLWLDELHTSWVVSGPLADVPGRARAGNQSPLYFLGVWGVVQLFGHTGWALRLISLASGTGLIVTVGILVWRWSDSVLAALLAAVLVAIQRDCIFYAQEARPYALLQLSAAVHAAIFVSMLRHPTRWMRCWYVLGAAWLCYLHYTAFLVLAAQAVCVVILWWSPRPSIRYGLSHAAIDTAWILLLLLPAAPHVGEIAARRAAWDRLSHAWPPAWSLQMAMLWFGIGPCVAVALERRWHGRRSAWAPAAVPVVWSACWFWIPLSIAWILATTGVAALLMVRYLVAPLVGAIVFATLCCAALRSALVRRGCACLLVAGTLATGGVVHQMWADGRAVGDRNEYWDQATEWLNRQLPTARYPVFLCANLLEDVGLGDHADPRLIDYCRFPLRGIYRLDAAEPEPLATRATITLTDAQLRRVVQQRHLWLIVRAGPDTTQHIARSLCRNLERAGLATHIVRQRRFGNLAVLQLGAT